MITPGNRMPFCAGMMADRQFYSFDVQAGRAAVLVLGAALNADKLNPVIDAFAACRTDIAAMQADLVVMLGFAAGPQAWESGPGAASGAPVVLCQDEFFIWCGMPDDTAMILVIDRASRIAASWAASELDPPALASAALAAVALIEREAAGACLLPAPVLAMPGLLDPALCQTLIAQFDAGASFDSGVSSLDSDSKPLDHLNHGKKRRRDWMLQPGTHLHDHVLDRLLARCVPEIHHAFRHEISHTDRVLVARYDDTGGYFKRHRDNRGETVAFRQFALSVNLNAGYEGGHLLFPEYNDHRYSPAAGGGIVFSTSLLHEAAPVTQGVRYVLLTFLHDTQAEARRVATLEAIRQRTQRIAVPA